MIGQKARSTLVPAETYQRQFMPYGTPCKDPCEPVMPRVDELEEQIAALKAEIDRLRAGEGQGPLVLPRRKEEAGRLDDTAGSPDDTLRDEVGNG